MPVIVICRMAKKCRLIRLKIQRKGQDKTIVRQRHQLLMIVSALKQSSTTAVFCKGAPFRPGACAWAAAMCRVAGNALAATCLAVAFLTIAKGVCSCFRHQHQVKMDAMVLILQKGGIPDHGRVVGKLRGIRAALRELER